MRNAPELFPPRQVLERCETFRPINAEAMRQRLAIWSALRDMD
jgi:spermidine/putrescine transport system substrate-binding protein